MGMRCIVPPMLHKTRIQGCLDLAWVGVGVGGVGEGVRGSKVQLLHEVVAEVRRSRVVV